MERDCDRFLMIAMALRDGEASSLPIAELNAHLSACPSCRSEIDGCAALEERFARVRRPTNSPRVWNAVLEQHAARRSRGCYIGLALLLGGVKSLELIFGREAPAGIEFFLALAAGAVLFLLRGDLFLIVTEVHLKGDRS